MFRQIRTILSSDACDKGDVLSHKFLIKRTNFADCTLDYVGCLLSELARKGKNQKSEIKILVISG